MAEVIGHVLDPAAGVEKVNRDRVPERVDRSASDAGAAAVPLKKVLDLALLYWTRRPVKTYFPHFRRMISDHRWVG